MSVIAVVSMKGGVGKTTVTANLAAALAKKLGDGRVSVVELDPQNAMHIHLNSGDGTNKSICAQSLMHQDWREVAQVSTFGVTVIPYGEASEHQRIAFEALLLENPDFIYKEIQRAGLDDDAVVLIDTPPGPSPYLKQAYLCADLVLVVMLADAGSYATIPAMEAWIDEMHPINPRAKSFYLVNQIDRSDMLNRDVWDVLLQRLTGKVIPFGIHRDESVRDALAFQQPVMEYDAYGQASNDLARLADFLIDGLSQ